MRNKPNPKESLFEEEEEPEEKTGRNWFGVSDKVSKKDMDKVD